MLVLDIETIPLQASLAAPFDRSTVTAPANYKDPAKIAEYIDKLEAEFVQVRVKTCSLNPRLGRVLSLAYSFGDEVKCLYAETEDKEADLLWAFWDLCKDPQASQLVTWNGAFDLRWLIIRSIANGVEPSVATTGWFKRYTFFPHCDVKAFLLQEWGSRVAGEGMDEWATFCGLQGKGDLDGSKVYAAFLAGQHDKIREYNMSDVTTTLALYQRIQPYL